MDIRLVSFFFWYQYIDGVAKYSDVANISSFSGPKFFWYQFSCLAFSGETILKIVCGLHNFSLEFQREATIN